MIKTCRTFTIFTFWMIIAILPAIAAEEEGNSVLLLEGRIKSILESEAKENPDIQNCKVIITMDFQRDPDTDEWIGNVDDISTSTEESSKDDLGYDEDVVTVNNDDDSTDKSDESDSSASNNIISWILGMALISVLLIFIFPSLKKYLQHKATYANNTENKRESPSANRQNQNSRHKNGHKSDSPPRLEQKKTTENIGATIQATNAVPMEIVDVTEKESEPEEEMVVEVARPTEPVAPLKPIVKYGQIAVLSQDELITENDYMSDNAAGMPFEFTFSPNMEEGTYDISSNSRQSFLSDVSMIRPYVQDFDALANPTMIVTINKGKLRKKGMQWVVTEKAKIELI